MEHGYAGTTMSGIAAALGGSKGTLWSYFPSKEALFSSALEEATNIFRAELAQILDDASGDVVSALRQFCISLTTKTTRSEAVALHRLVLSETSRFPEVGAIFFDRAPHMTQKLLAEYLSGAMDSGFLRRDDPLAMARELFALCLAGSHQKLLLGVSDTPQPDVIERDVNRALDIFLRAYAA